MKPLSAVCGICSEEQGKDTAAYTKAVEEACGAMFQMISKSSDFTGFQSLPDGLISAVNAWVECQAGERVGAVNGLDSVHSGRKSRPLKGFSDLESIEITVP